MSDKLAQIFAKMNFFELPEDNGVIVYCYETNGDDRYLIASDELGNTPKETENIIIACYSEQDAFSWKIEFKTIDQLVAAYHENKNFIDVLDKLNSDS